MSKKSAIPKFKSEAEEAKWWYEHREETTRAMADAVAKGRTTTLPKILERAKRKIGPRPTVSIRVDPADLTRARIFSSRKGLQYQTYLNKLLDQALAEEGELQDG